MQLLRLIVIMTYFYYVQATSDFVLHNMMKTYKQLEQNSADSTYHDHIHLLEKELESFETKYNQYKNTTQKITEELEYEQWSSNLFLNNIDLENNKIFFANGTCRHNAYQDYKILYEYFYSNIYIHSLRVRPHFMKLNKLYNEEIQFIRSYHDKFKKSLASSKEKHDQNLEYLNEPGSKASIHGKHRLIKPKDTGNNISVTDTGR